MRAEAQVGTSRWAGAPNAVNGGGVTVRGRREPFLRPVVLTGWSSRSAWGYDDVLECYWAELWPAARCGSAQPGSAQPEWAQPESACSAHPVRVGPEHLITTVTGLARAVGHATGAGDAEAYLALTA